MAMETYTLEIAETDDHEEITADVYDEEGLIEASARVGYDDVGLSVDRDDWTPEPVRRDFTADVMTMDVQFSYAEREFEFQVLGDRDELLSERVEDDDWRLG